MHVPMNREVTMPRQFDAEVSGSRQVSQPPPGHCRAFVLPPQHRLFCVLDDARRLSSVLRVILEEAVPSEDIWVFSRDTDAHLAHPGLLTYGPPLAFIQSAQRVLARGCEYCELLSSALDAGAAVLSMFLGPEHVDARAFVLEEQGARSIVYGRHLSFTAPQASMTQRAG
jgi:hypothetical protein